MIEGSFAAFVEVDFRLQVLPYGDDKVAEAVGGEFLSSFVPLEENAKRGDERKHEKVLFVCHVVILADALSRSADEARDVHEGERPLHKSQIQLQHSKHRPNARSFPEQMIKEVDEEQLLKSGHALSSRPERPDHAAVSVAVFARNLSVVLSLLVNLRSASSPRR